MKTRIIIVVKSIICLMLFSELKAQQYVCGHDIQIHQMESKYPGFQHAMNETFKSARMIGKAGSGRREVLKIKVAVHIVWNKPEENIHDSLIYNQIEILNQDFRLQNEDRVNVRDIFKERQGDAGIEFEIAEIIRVQTSTTFTPFLITLPDEVKQSSEGGSDALDTDKYLNIWVCKIQPVPFLGAQILGYAHPPAGLAHWPAGAEAALPGLDGVVIDFRCFGRNNPNIALLPAGINLAPRGRTTTHEVGHYLGLRHIWADGSVFGGSSCDVDDGVEDTPNQGKQSDNTCDTNQNTCEDAIQDEPDLIENYMDYSDQNCQNTFTKGQIQIMRGVLETARNGLLELSASTSHSSVLDGIKIFPNPASENLNLTFTGHSGFVEIEVFNAFGCHIGTKSGELNSGDMLTFAISDWSPGIYWLRIQNQKHTSKSFKFIKL